MSTRERRRRDIAEREKLFLQKARELVREEGLLHLQMTRLAGECQYATGTLYQHFESKEDLLVGLLADGVEARVRLFERASAWDAAPRDRMFAMAVADTVFVRHHPEHFRVAQFATTEVVWAAASEARRNNYLELMKPVGELVLGVVGDAVTVGDLDVAGASAREAAIGVWTVVVGTHELVHAHGVLESWDVRDPYRLMGRSIHRLLNGLDWRPLFDLRGPGAYEAYLQRLRDEVFNEMCC